jgi:chromosome segregation ATPase
MYNLTDISFVMNLQHMNTKLEDEKADLQRQLSSATTRYEESEHRHSVAESKLAEFECLHKDLESQHSNLQAAYNVLPSQLEVVETKASATAMESQLSKTQVIGSCGLD